MRRLAVANGPNIFQMLLVLSITDRSFRYASPCRTMFVVGTSFLFHFVIFIPLLIFSFSFRHLYFLFWVSSLIIPMSFTHGLKPIFNTNHSRRRLFLLSRIDSMDSRLLPLGLLLRFFVFFCFFLFLFVAQCSRLSWLLAYVSFRAHYK